MLTANNFIKMKLVHYILLCHIGWLSATLMIYHEKSMKEFGGKITSDKTSFGYSITYTPDNKRLIVSAPKANDLGALFSCDVDKSDCTSIPTGKDVEAPKDFHIWLGATMRAGSNFFMTCAPRYRVKNGNRPSIHSRCYKYSNTGRHNSKLMPLASLPDYYLSKFKFEHRMLTFGWSMDIDENDNALIGGPAMYTGRAVKYDYSSVNLTKPPITIVPGNINGTFLELNFGYSVMHRNYKSEMQVVVSSTFGENGYGMVVIFKDKNGAVIYKIKGNQVGAMFGASLCTARVDSKGQALLLVGAPTYTSDNKYNTGAVFIYKDEDRTVFHKIIGTRDGGQFGYALANLGDLNGDDKDEIAISAPYEDNGHGAVYIYSGAQIIDRDKDVKWLQRLQRSEYRSFGLSLYAIPDYDRNGCKELAIGIPDNDNAVLFHCFATIKVTVRQLKFNKKIPDATGSSSFMFESCLAFQYPDLPETITANFLVSLKKENIDNVLIKLRATGKSSKESLSYNIHVTSDKKQEYCEDIIITAPTDKTYDPTLHYQISAVLLDDPKTMSTFDPSQVTVSDLSKLTVPGATWIGECESGDKCNPKLEMNVNISVTNTSYVVGSTDVETVRISVQNNGDPAYETCVRVFLHGITPLSRPPSCIVPSDVKSKETLICTPTKLLRNKTSWDIDEIKLDMKSIRHKAEGGDDNFYIHVHLYEECNTHISVKNMTQHTALLWDSEHVTAIGSIKNSGMINITRNEIETSSKQIQHEYEIANNGPTTWHNVKVKISLQKEFYLDGISPTSGPFYQCTPAEETDKQYINHCIITILKKYTKFEIVQPIDVMSKIYETLKKRHLKVTSSLKMSLDGHEKLASVTTTLRFYQIEVPTWIIIVAVLFGLLIIVIIVFILYECGFLRRKKKDDLTHLRRSVQRQSMRRTTMMNHNVDTSDTERLLDPADGDKPDTETASTSTIVEVTEMVDIHNKEDNKNEVKPVQCEHNTIDKPIEKAVCHIKPKEINAAANTIEPTKTNKTDGDDVKIDRKPSVKTKKNDPIAGIIIGGLQKNISRQRGIHPSVEDDRSVE